VARDDLDDEARLRMVLRRAVRAFERSPQMLRVQLVVDRSSDPNAAALYREFSAVNTAVMTAVLHDVDPTVAPAVINVVQGVLWAWLGWWAHGRSPIREVDAVVQETIGLIFGGPPPLRSPA
jgi:hypothetical protein